MRELVAHIAQLIDHRAFGATEDGLVHAHFVPQVYREAALATGHSHPDGMPGLPAWSETDMLATMDRQGIDVLFLSISSHGVHFGNDAAARRLARVVNIEGSRLKARHPSRFGHLASLPLPDVEGSLAEIGFAFDMLKADGLSLEVNCGGIYAGDARFDPVLAELDPRGAVLLLHPISSHITTLPMLRADRGELAGTRNRVHVRDHPSRHQPVDRKSTAAVSWHPLHHPAWWSRAIGSDRPNRDRHHHIARHGGLLTG
ncbi:MAG: amidohydrolase family protein [Nitrospira sp.]|nr:amidohydrolase family protein [Nitrospira sp.]